jgi:hypothetical protein
MCNTSLNPGRYRFSFEWAISRRSSRPHRWAQASRTGRAYLRRKATWVENQFSRKRVVRELLRAVRSRRAERIVAVSYICPPGSSRITGFYEKVVKVKDDVAAILKFFFRGRSRLTIWTRPQRCPSGGCARGVSAERFETPLAGGAAAPMRASAFCWRAACQRLGGNPPAPAFPRWGKRERGRSDFRAADIRARSTTTLLSIVITNLSVNPLVYVPLSRSLAGCATQSFAVLLSALSNGPH